MCTPLGHYTENGQDSIEFMISTNPGETVKPLGKVASGGELSRIMLAVKSVLADADAIETLIFDEIDTGISGRTAQKVSEKMAVIARKHQVICITHLPQIAAMADDHYVIEKTAMEQRTITEIHHLSDEASVGRNRTSAGRCGDHGCSYAECPRNEKSGAGRKNRLNRNCFITY